MLLNLRYWLVLSLVVMFGLGNIALPQASAAEQTLIAQAKKKKKSKKKKRRKKSRRKKRKSKGLNIQAGKKKKQKTSREDEVPQGPAKIKLPMIEEKKSTAATLEEKLLDEEIDQLRDIIGTTEGPAKADLLFRLAERYYEKSRAIYYQEMQEYDKKVAAWIKEQEKNPKAKEPKLDSRKSQVYTKQTMDIYKIILKNYKNYHRRDEVLFTMGYNLYESGQKSEGVKNYWELIKNFPKSPFVPDAYLAMGEHYFNANDVINAKKAYDKALEFTNSKVYGFALYKLAWCDYNLGDYEQSMKKFKDVITLAEKEAQMGAKGDANKIQLKRESLQDLILVFSQVDALDEAEEFYLSQVGKQKTLNYMRRLAATYLKQGKSEMVVKSYRRLLNEYPTSKDCPAFHNAIVMAYRKMNKRDKVTQEVNRLIEQYKPGSHWAEVNKSNKMAIAKANSLVEGALRDLVTGYHKEAQDTKSWDTYNLARGIYAKYLETFPNSEYAYKLRWYYSDILYKMGDFYSAAKQFAEVVKKDPKGAFSQEASFNAVLSWDKCINLRDRKKIDCRKWKAKTGKGKLGREESRTIREERMQFVTSGKVSKNELEKREIPFFEKKFLEAADVYAKVSPKHDMYIPIRFKSAYFFYQYRHFREMARRFGEIIERYPNNQFALKAVRLSLNTMYMKATSEDFSQDEKNENWKEINHWSKTFVANKVLMGSQAAKKEKFKAEVQSLVEESGYNVILALREKDTLKAAKGFKQFVADYPKSKYSHRALYAAVVIFNEANQLDLAIDAGKRLLKEYPDSDRINPTIGFLADFQNRVANFSQAARYNEMYFEKWIGQGSKNKKSRKKSKAKKDSVVLITDKEAMNALYNAALIRESMGEFDKGISNYVKYIKHFPEANDVPDIFYKIGKIYERRELWRKADRVYAAYPDKYTDRSNAGRLLDVIYRHAMVLRKLEKTKDSDKLLEKIVLQYNDLDEKSKDEDARKAVSHARFLQLENEFNEYINIKLVLPPRTLKKNLFQKIDIRPKLEKKYEEIVGYKDPDWSVAALLRIAQLSQNLSQAMYDAPVPRGLTPDQADIYVQELHNQALPLEEKAINILQKAISVSNIKGIYSLWTIEAQNVLREFQQNSYPKPYNADLVSTEYFYRQGPKLDKVEVPKEQAPKTQVKKGRESQAPSAS
jgi:TolA-binding protein